MAGGLSRAIMDREFQPITLSNGREVITISTLTAAGANRGRAAILVPCPGLIEHISFALTCHRLEERALKLSETFPDQHPGITISAARRPWLGADRNQPSHRLPARPRWFRPVPGIPPRLRLALLFCRRQHLVQELPDEAERVRLIVMHPDRKAQKLRDQIASATARHDAYAAPSLPSAPRIDCARTALSCRVGNCSRTQYA